MILRGDCIEQMKTLPDNSVDAIVTDPPYGLEFMGKEWDKFKHGNTITNPQGAFEHKKGFKKMVRLAKDYETMLKMQEFFTEFSKEALRVLKPGAFLLAFGGTRTYHRLACGIEDAGFEIRDCIQWLYGSGFPKSYNVGKGVESVLTQGSASWNDFHKLKGELGESKSQGANGLVKLNSEQGNRPKKYASHGTLKLEPTTPEAKQWEGWGTALKPANEPIVVARKPLSEKNVALNVLKWGTGGINIDACRIGTDGGTKHQEGEKEYNNEIYGKGLYKDFGKPVENLGRFPANIILDEEAGKMLGEPSRFFYCAKASKKERNLGCEDMEDKKCMDMASNRDFQELRGRKKHIPIAKNNHPTVKPIKLMEYLIKLVSPEGATILDPFMGSGTTGCACVNLNRKFIGIDKEEDYIKIAEARINKARELF